MLDWFNWSRRTRRTSLALGLATSALAGLGACASYIPNDGPMLSDVEAEASKGNGEFPFDLIEVGPAVAAAVNDHASLPVPHLFSEDQGKPITLGPGDVLSITVYQAGPGGPFAAPSSGTGGPSGGAASFTVSKEMVDEQGEIPFPYVGRVHVGGQTASEVGRSLEKSLSATMVEPQVVIDVSSDLASTVTLTGAIKTPGRPALTPSGERLLQLIAAAGGPGGLPGDTLIEVTRHGRTEAVSMEDLIEHPEADIQARPGDLINLVEQPRTYLVFGAVGKVEAQPIGIRRLTLAEAMAHVGGTKDIRADRAALLVFRYEYKDVLDHIPGTTIREQPNGPERGLTPVVYQINLGTAEGYFMAMKFPIREHDVIFTPNAIEVQWQKFLDLVRISLQPATTGTADAAK